MKSYFKKTGNKTARFRNTLLVRMVLKRHGSEIGKRLKKKDRLPGERVLILAPHVDDDIIGCGYAIRDYLKRGKEVVICYLTKGDTCRPAYPMSRQQIQRAREEEAVDVAQHMGMVPENLHFLEAEDDSLWDNEPVARKLAEVIFRTKPDVIYCPAVMDKHPDHVASGRLLIDAMGGMNYGKPVIMIYEVQNPITLYYANVAFPVEKNVSWKREMCRFYRSQSLMFDFLEPMSRYNAALFEDVSHAELYLQTDLVRLNAFYRQHQWELQRMSNELFNVRNEWTFWKAWKTSLKKKSILMELR